MARRILAAALVLAAASALMLGLGGCSSLQYMGQAVGGHLEVLNRARPVQDLLDDAATPPALRDRLELTQRMRRFAVEELALPDNASYRRYADLQRSAVVWNVVATPELSLELKTWCFPVAGCVGYRGYYAEASAQATARTLQAQGFETQVYGVPAYSTLGFSNWVGGDPLLNTFLQWNEADLAKLIFHELAHQVVYVDDDTAFNEGYATAVERLGGRLWMQRHGSPQALAQMVRQEELRAQFRDFTAHWRSRLQALYAGPLPADEQRVRKAELMAAMRAAYTQLKQQRLAGFGGWDGWVERANNASFAVQAAYHEWVPAFEALFEQEGRDFARFHARVQALSKRPREQRREALRRLLPPPPAATAPS